MPSRQSGALSSARPVATPSWAGPSTPSPTPQPPLPAASAQPPLPVATPTGVMPMTTPTSTSHPGSTAMFPWCPPFLWSPHPQGGLQGYPPQLYGGTPPMAPPTRDPALIKEIVSEVVSQVIICMPTLISKKVPVACPSDPNCQTSNTTNPSLTHGRSPQKRKE